MNEIPAEQNRLLAAKDASATHNTPIIRQDDLKGRFTFALFLAVAAAAGGSSFIFGYTIGNINPPGDDIQDWIQNGTYTNMKFDNETGQIVKQRTKAETDAIFDLVIGFFPLGGILGGISCGYAADRFGRKGAMLFNNGLCFIATAFLSLSYYHHFWMLYVGRFLIGINCGLSSGLAPMYLMEIAPVNYRGMLGSFNQLMVTVSIMVAGLLGLEEILSQKGLWPILLALTAVPAVWQCCSLPFCPESPKYLLVTKHQHSEAEKALKRLRQKVDVSAEMKALQIEADKVANAPKVSFGDMFSKPMLRWALTIASMMMLAQQFSGINAAFFFSNEIFTNNAGLKRNQAAYATLGMCGVNVIMTIIATAIVDRFGRRLLLLAGMAGMWVCSILISVMLLLVTAHHEWAAYMAIVFIYCFVISFATGPGAIPWFYVSELFDLGARGHANAVAVMLNWGANTVVAFGFGPWAKWTGAYAFLIFTGTLTFFWLFTFFFAPETKGRPLEDVQQELRKKAPPGCR